MHGQVGKPPEGNILIERPRSRWEYNIIKALEEIELEGLGSII